MHTHHLHILTHSQSYYIHIISYTRNAHHHSYIIKIKGLLKVGVPQPWIKSKPNLNYVREAGVKQFISTYNRVKNLKGDELLWGDEVEYGIFVLDEERKMIRLSLRAKEVR